MLLNHGPLHAAGCQLRLDATDTVYVGVRDDMVVPHNSTRATLDVVANVSLNGHQATIGLQYG